MIWEEKEEIIRIIKSTRLIPINAIFPRPYTKTDKGIMTSFVSSKTIALGRD